MPSKQGVLHSSVLLFCGGSTIIHTIGPIESELSDLNNVPKIQTHKVDFDDDE